LLAPVEIAGVASCVPARVVTNHELEKLVDTSDEWISKRTGIKTRHIAVEETAVGMAAQAAAEALAMSGIEKDDIGLIVASTISGDNLTPALASSVQRTLDIPHCAAMDISAGCTGFVYALVTAASLMDTLGAGSALVVASEVMSKYIDWTDRTTCVLFGDGAGAVVLRRSEKSHMHFPVLNAVPDTDDAIVIKKEARSTPFGPSADGRMEYIRMKGSEVFTYASGVMEDTLRRLMELCGDRPYTKIIPHQANEKIIDYVMRTMRLDREQFYINIAEYANTSSASISIAMADAYQAGWLMPGDRVALVGFGSGLTSGGVVIDWTMPNKKEN
jgi:3-oxoacyl-[acyl-carrier-protein] synthase-3